MSNTIVKFEGIKKTIGNKTIVEGISFDIKKGEILGFLGPNGAGKTTTMSMLLGLMSISAGNIYVNGINVRNNLNKALNYVGGIIEGPDMYKYLTGYKNLILFSRMYKNIPRSKIDEIVQLLKMEDYIHKKVKIYSLGMKQRLGLAQSLLHSPELLVLDEPSNGLDPAGIKEFKIHLKELATTKNVAIFISSHILSEIENLCDRVVIINKGKIITIKTINELKSSNSEDKTILNVSPVDRALELIKIKFPNNKVSIINNKIEIIIEEDKVSELVSNLSSAGISINGVNKESKSLEDIFLEMTGGN